MKIANFYSYKMMKIRSVIKICRFCGLQIKDEVHLFNNKILLEKSYSPVEIFNIVFKDLEINENDELPKEICLQCLNNILLSFRFYNIIKNTKVKLTEILIQKKTSSDGKYKLILPKTEEKLFVNHNIVLSDDKRMYNCYECTEKFRALRQLKKHRENLHATANLCNFCNTWYNNDMDLQKHQTEKHQDLIYECLKCKRERFSSQRRLFNHYSQKHFFQNGYFKCETCQEEFYERQDLNSHIKNSHIKSIENIDDNVKDINTLGLNFRNRFNGPSDQEIEITNKEYPTIKTETNFDNKLDEVMDVEFLDEFFLSQHTDNSFAFNECWDVLDLSLEDDIKIKMSDIASEIFSESQGKNASGKIYQYQCPHCKKGFASQIEILIHLAHYHNLAVLTCGNCSEKFSNLNDYKMHNIQHLGKNINNFDETKMEIIKKLDKILYMCKYCRKKYKEKSNFALHVCKKRTLKNQHNLKRNNSSNFSCNLCKEEFFNLRTMQIHKRKVHLSKDYECHICKKIFKTTLGFKYHLKTHEGLKSLECPFCNRKFLTKVNLNAHIKAIHSIVKNHLCTLCDRNFATLDHLKKHVMSVHQKERSHLCSVCGKLFSQVSHLKSHFKIHNLD